MARFGGRYSPPPPGENEIRPGGDPRLRDKSFPVPPGPYAGKRRKRAGGRVNLLFLAPIVFLLNGFLGTPTELGLNLAAFATLILAAWLTREGVGAQEAYDARNVARRPAIPRKIFASVLTGGALFLGGMVPGQSFLNPIIFAILGMVLHAMAFGPDPLRDKGMTGADRAEGDRVARAVDEGERHLSAMTDAIQRAGERSLIERVARFATTARAMFRRIEDDPRDLTASRKYLGVYLMGARDATIKFADLYSRSRDSDAKREYEALLDDLETNFTDQTQKLLVNDRTALDIEIEVLRERLSREGVKAG